MRLRRPRSRVVAVGSDAGRKPRNTAEAPEIAAVLDTGNRSESNACSGGEGEIAGGEVKAHLGNPGSGRRPSISA
jgi:hypothetical protein